MYISRIFLKDFRNFNIFDHEFTPGCNLIVAPNGSGKTNILESIQILSLAKSLRASSQIDLIQHDKSNALIKAKFNSITLEYNIRKLDIGQRVAKILKRNDKNVNSETFSSAFTSLWFSAETMNVINASSSVKRDFIDNFIGSINKQYFETLRKYKIAIYQKNILLTKSEVVDIQRYTYLNQIIVKYGAIVIEMRSKYMNKLKKHLESDRFERYKYYFEYQPNIECSYVFDEDIETKFIQKFSEYKQKELLSRRCLIGPHKDTWKIDFSVKDEMHDLGTFGSRGQKRIGVLAILMSFLQIVEEETHAKPILLLDDITSELDETNISMIEKIIADKDMQTFITATSSSIFAKKYLDEFNVLDLRTKNHNDVRSLS